MLIETPLFQRVVLIYLDSCNYYQYTFVNYKEKSGSNCASFCQCAPLRTNSDGSIDYYWASHDCPEGTLWSKEKRICDHSYNVNCGKYTPS